MGAKIYISFEVIGLGEDLRDKHLAEPSDTVTGKISPKTHLLGVAGTEEQIDLSSLDSVRGLMIKSLSKDAYVDLDYDGETFNPMLKLIEGKEPTYIPCPQGDVYFKNSEDGETPSIEFSAWGIAS